VQRLHPRRVEVPRLNKGGEMSLVSVDPYKHDCPSCQWLGWHSETGGKLVNIYICLPDGGAEGLGALIIRYSDSSALYNSYPIRRAEDGTIEGVSPKGPIVVFQES
jgi:hypothetical protein